MYKGMLKVTKQSEQDRVSKSQVESATSTLSTKSLGMQCFSRVILVAIAVGSKCHLLPWQVRVRSQLANGTLPYSGYFRLVYNRI